MNAVWLIWLIIVPVLIAALFVGAMLPKARRNRTAWLVGDLPVIALGMISISAPLRYVGALW